MVLAELVGRPRATLVRMLDEPLPTVELARRLAVTPSAVSQHLRVLHAGGLVTRARDGRTVLYRRSAARRSARQPCGVMTARPVSAPSRMRS
jgi:DNA-binding transcriptional ArsR family regulator